MKQLTLALLPFSLTIARLRADQELPAWASAGQFFSITRTAEELSVVCESALAPAGGQAEPGWRGLKVIGPLDFSLIGILAGLSGTLAQAGISLFAISTYDTDYLLIKEDSLEAALAALRGSGYAVQE